MRARASYSAFVSVVRSLVLELNTASILKFFNRCKMTKFDEIKINNNDNNQKYTVKQNNFH